MKKIEAYIRPDKLQDIKEGLSKYDISGMSISQIMGYGNQKGWKEYVRGSEVECNFLQKIKIELIVLDEQVDDMINTIMNISQTGEFGDGKIFISSIENAIRIRTGETGASALK